MRLSDIVAAMKSRQAADAERYANLDGDLCQLCHAYGADKRTLIVRYFYAIEEVVPEVIDLSGVEDGKREGYMLRTCKRCRGEFLGMMERWADECRGRRGTPKDHDGETDPEWTEGLIPVRQHGRTVYVTEEQWREMRTTPNTRGNDDG